MSDIIALSGGFDPLHAGHLHMIKDAAEYGEVVILLNSDDWLNRKKGYAFMGWAERAYILRSITGVSDVLPVDDYNDNVVEGLKRLRPKFFGNGGDRLKDNTPELDYCYSHNITPVFGLGGGKVQSSSELVERSQKLGAVLHPAEDTLALHKNSALTPAQEAFLSKALASE